MQLFVWRTSIIQGYFEGTVAAVASSAQSAREAIMADFDRWIRTGFEPAEHSPMAYYFDGITPGLDHPEWASEEERAEMEAEIACHRAELALDIEGDPVALPGGILYAWGGD